MKHCMWLFIASFNVPIHKMYGNLIIVYTSYISYKKLIYDFFGMFKKIATKYLFPF